ncbi:ATP-binding protein [uncultured Imperialibacter sp.]|uniref:sensor histidine kinase n=1 Tax=uncultured Imperialibacter sp. TaxID=1672639 RepID=UPI0030DC04E5|tara:strand:- start:1008 stop:2564 length:1557 start_codon:yes stop_codon:yes gene_type:complete
MRTSFAKISFILVLVIVLPISVLVIFEVRSLNQSVAMMQAIYDKEIDTFLFSINQYSDDVVNSMTTRIDDAWSRKGAGEFPKEILEGYPGVSAIFFFPLEKKQKLAFYAKDEIPQQQLITLLENHIREDSALVKKMTGYRSAGFRKIEPYKVLAVDGERFNTLLMVLGENPDTYSLCVMIIRPSDFIEELIAPKMEQVAGEEFVLAASNKVTGELIYTTDSLMNNKARSKTIWLLPEYELEIYIPGNSIEMVMQERSNTNMIMIGMVSLVLLLGFAMVFRNIRAEMQLAQTKSDFVSNVSHEIRTPLSLISMFAETLLLGRVTTETRKKEYYEIIVKETGRLTNIVNKILNFSQIEANKKTYHLESVLLNDIVREVLHTYSFHLENKGFTYKVHFTDDLPNMMADTESVMEAIINLLDNAIKYSPDTKHLDISTERMEQWVVVAVKDQGVGIEEKKLKQIFDKFYRVTQGDIYNTQGAGLGLSIVKHIMEAHSGQITVESEPGKGSTFKLMFPILVKK